LVQGSGSSQFEINLLKQVNRAKQFKINSENTDHIKNELNPKSFKRTEMLSNDQINKIESNIKKMSTKSKIFYGGVPQNLVKNGYDPKKQAKDRLDFNH